MKKNLLLIACLAGLSNLPARSQQPADDTSVISRIRQEALDHSQVMHIAHYLTDVAGSRLTNSPGYERASRWAVKTLAGWGLRDAHLEAWGRFGQGWSIEHCSIAMAAPYYMPLIGYPFAWTRGTSGPITAQVVLVGDLQVDSIRKLGAVLKGKLVMTRKNNAELPSAFKAFAERYSDSALAHLGDTYMIGKEELSGMMGLIDQWRRAIRLLQQLGAAGVLYSSASDRDGTVSASAWFTGTKGAWPDLPVLALAREHYLMIQRLVADSQPVRLQLNVQTRFWDKDPNGYNVIAEIPGTDPTLKSQLVMLGGHLDSWYAGTGATDNAAGCAVMMEVVRIFQALHLSPRRTIRIALWSGEEQGLLGSHGYALRHFGDPVTMKLLPEQARVSAYYNLDNGSGRIRGIFTQGNQAVVPLFRQWLAPFADLGASTVTTANTGSTDHFTFDAVGIPAFQFIQDPLEYETRTHHTNMDTYDHLQADDLKQAAAVVAAFVYHTAMQDDLLPRKPLPQPGPWLFDLFH
ncbi:MAG TPA: M20/M25/M40 family metallo-hydrolase [Chitinophagaceae bacterium]|nr:M20/M25/M40 family metallo-hydrolase [Chitinophagaceae bacterium]